MGNRNTTVHPEGLYAIASSPCPLEGLENVVQAHVLPALDTANLQATGLTRCGHLVFADVVPVIDGRLPPSLCREDAQTTAHTLLLTCDINEHYTDYRPDLLTRLLIYAEGDDPRDACHMDSAFVASLGSTMPNLHRVCASWYCSPDMLERVLRHPGVRRLEIHPFTLREMVHTSFGNRDEAFIDRRLRALVKAVQRALSRSKRGHGLHTLSLPLQRSTAALLSIRGLQSLRVHLVEHDRTRIPDLCRRVAGLPVERLELAGPIPDSLDAPSFWQPLTTSRIALRLHNLPHHIPAPGTDPPRDPGVRHLAVAVIDPCTQLEDLLALLRWATRGGRLDTLCIGLHCSTRRRSCSVERAVQTLLNKIPLPVQRLTVLLDDTHPLANQRLPYDERSTGTYGWEPAERQSPDFQTILAGRNAGWFLMAAVMPFVTARLPASLEFCIHHSPERYATPVPFPSPATAEQKICNELLTRGVLRPGPEPDSLHPKHRVTLHCRRDNGAVTMDLADARRIPLVRDLLHEWEPTMLGAAQAAYERARGLLTLDVSAQALRWLRDHPDGGAHPPDADLWDVLQAADFLRYHDTVLPQLGRYIARRPGMRVAPRCLPPARREHPAAVTVPRGASAGHGSTVDAVARLEPHPRQFPARGAPGRRGVRVVND